MWFRAQRCLSRRLVAGCSARHDGPDHLRVRAFSSSPTSPIQLVALDVDGTLLDKNHKLHPRSKDAILAACNLGVPVVLATGRCPRAAFGLLNAGLQEPLPLQGGAFLGGALALDTFGKARRDVKLPAEVVSRALSFAEDHALTPVLFSRDKGRDNIWCAAANEWTQRLVEMGDPPPSGVGQRALLRRVTKVNLLTLLGDMSQLDALEPDLAKLLAGSYAQVVRPCGVMLDVVPVDEGGLAGKAAALAEICAWRGIASESVMAVGDSGNDVDMLRWAGWAVAVGNAMPVAKAEADVIVAANDEPLRPGVAEALEDFVIKPLAQ